MKRVICITLSLLVLILAGCGLKNCPSESVASMEVTEQSPAAAPEEVALKKATEYTKNLDILAASQYTEMMARSDDISALAAGFAEGDHESPVKAVILRASFDIFLEMASMELSEAGKEIEEMDKVVVDHLRRASGAAVPNMLIGTYYGSLALAASSVLTESDAFICDTVFDDIYAVFLFYSGTPGSVTTFFSDKGVVSATSRILPEEMTPEWLVNESMISEYLIAGDITVYADEELAELLK